LKIDIGHFTLTFQQISVLFAPFACLIDVSCTRNMHADTQALLPARVIASGNITDAVFNILTHTAVQTSVRAGERLSRKLELCLSARKD
jgi:hypothetical protein